MKVTRHPAPKQLAYSPLFIQNFHSFWMTSGSILLIGQNYKKFDLYLKKFACCENTLGSAYNEHPTFTINYISCEDIHFYAWQNFLFWDYFFLFVVGWRMSRKWWDPHGETRNIFNGANIKFTKVSYYSRKYLLSS